MTAYNDLTTARTQTRQHEMMLALRRTGLGRHIERNLPEIVLDPAFCQWASRDLRFKIQRRVEAIDDAFEGRADMWLVTWVPSDALNVELLPEGPSALIKRFTKACVAVEASAVALALEPDFDVKEQAWQPTIHAVLFLPYATDARKVSTSLSRALGSSMDDTGRVYRPLVVKHIYDLKGATSYTFKSLAVLSIGQRSTWYTDEGRPRARMQSLRTPQTRQLLLQTQRDGLASRTFIRTFSEVV